MGIPLDPGQAIDPPPVAVATCSIPSDRQGGASGDWYDVIALPTGEVAVVVGDAAGHGVQARPLKDALQRGLRRMAMAGMEPCELVNGLDDVVVPDRDGYATLVYAIVEPRCGDVVMTNAGHPPPLVVGRGGSARFLTNILDPPLGAPRSPTSPEVGRTHLGPGDTLVLYTDGLVERRTRDIGAGLDGLAALAARFAGASLDELCARLLCLALDNSETVDDLTVIALRLQNGTGSPGVDHLRPLRVQQAPSRPSGVSEGAPNRRKAPHRRFPARRDNHATAGCPARSRARAWESFEPHGTPRADTSAQQGDARCSCASIRSEISTPSPR